MLVDIAQLGQEIQGRLVPLNGPNTDNVELAAEILNSGFAAAHDWGRAIALAHGRDLDDRETRALAHTLFCAVVKWETHWREQSLLGDHLFLYEALPVEGTKTPEPPRKRDLFDDWGDDDES